jgi:hypothetical protein
MPADTMKVAKGGVTGDKKISNLKKPGKQGKIGGISTPFSNRITSGRMGGKR